MANVLITGATGFIGPHLASRLLERGDRVTCLVRARSNLDRLRGLDVEFVRGDVTDRDSLEPAVAGTDVVYHLAAVTKTPLRGADLMRINESGTRNLLEACAAQTTPPVVVITSSLAAAGPAPDGRPLTEADPPRPASKYGHSKRACERAAESLADRVPITILRPPIVFGRGDVNMLSMIQPIARFGVHVVPGFTVRRVALVYADDLVTALLQAADRGRRLAAPAEAPSQPGQGYYFITATESPSYAELGRRISEAINMQRFRAVRTPEALTWIAAGGAQLMSQIRRHPHILSIDKVREATAGSWLCSIERAREELGYEPGAPLLEQLRETIDWYVEQGWLSLWPRIIARREAARRANATGAELESPSVQGGA
jgi:nucleoside-diphosphate-sugar epimerase